MATKEKKETIGRVKLENVRLSFCDSIFEAQSQVDDEGKEGPPKHHANFLIPKPGTAAENPQSKGNLAKLKKAKEEVMMAFKKWGGKPPKLEPHKLCTRDGDLKEYDGYADHYYVSAGSDAKHPPLLIDRQRNDIKETDALLYAGCWVNATVRLWAQDNKYGKRINAQLEGIQFLRHDEAFGAAPLDRNTAFDDLSEEGEVEDESGDAEDMI